jgi:membrane protease subunit HflC
MTCKPSPIASRSRDRAAARRRHRPDQGRSRPFTRASVTPERVKIAAQTRAEAAAQADALGVELVDVRLRRPDLPPETSRAIYDRMTSERVREANDLRAQASEWAQEIRAQADRERAILLSEAQRESQISRGVADAEASRILADAYAQDPDFFELYPTLQVYRTGLTVGRRPCCSRHRAN